MANLLTAFQRTIDTFTSYCEQSSSCTSLSPEKFKSLIQKEFVDIVKGSSHPETIEAILRSTKSEKPVDFLEFCDILKNVAVAYYDALKSKKGQSPCEHPKEKQTAEKGSESAMSKLLAAIQGTIDIFTSYSSQSSSHDKLSPEEFKDLIQKEFVNATKNSNNSKTFETLEQYENTKNQKPVEFEEFLDFLKNLAKAYYDDLKSSIETKQDQVTTHDPTQKHNQLTPHSPTEKHDQPTSHGPTQKHDQPTTHCTIQKHDQPTSHGPTQKQDQPTRHGPTQKQDQLTPHSPTEKHDQPPSHGPTQKHDQPTTHCTIQKQDQPTSHGPTQKQDQPATHGYAEKQDQKQDSDKNQGQTTMQYQPAKKGSNKKHD